MQSKLCSITITMAKCEKSLTPTNVLKWPTFIWESCVAALDPKLQTAAWISPLASSRKLLRSKSQTWGLSVLIEVSMQMSSIHIDGGCSVSRWQELNVSLCVFVSNRFRTQVFCAPEDEPKPRYYKSSGVRQRYSSHKCGTHSTINTYTYKFKWNASRKKKCAFLTNVFIDSIWGTRKAICRCVKWQPTNRWINENN